MAIKKAIFTLFAAMLVTAPASDLEGFSGGSNIYVPEVAYERPKDGSALDLAGKDIVVFEWNRVPIPGSGRCCYRFVLYKENPMHETIMKERLEAQTFSIQVPADTFEDGAEYSWYVKQRDERTMVWSRYEKWYFKVKK